MWSPQKRFAAALAASATVLLGVGGAAPAGAEPAAVQSDTVAQASAAASVVAGSIAAPAVAAGMPGFDAGRIIDDSLFYNGGSMSTAEIQGFLDGHIAGSCRPGATCLKDARFDIPAMDVRGSDGTRYCSPIQAKSNVTAAEVISTVALACNISPKVLLVTLQKEQGIVTSTAPSSWAYSFALGFNCPDSGAGCDSSSSGFVWQVYLGARQFQVYRVKPQLFNFRAGQVANVQYSTNAACGTKTVTIQNAATAGLYNYTPYTPNQAALNNPYGTGDGCSAYGNRNFWVYYTDWFGSTLDVGSPFGSFDSITSTAAGVTVRGWTIDPDATEPLQVRITSGSSTLSTVVAGDARPDVAAVYPASGADHGFSTTLALPEGTHSICVWAVNVGAGGDVLLGCRTIGVHLTDPFGAVDSFEVAATGITVSGWAWDPNSAASIWLHVYVDGAFWNGVHATRARPDIARAYPTVGSNAGFSFSIVNGIDTAAIAPGSHQVCIYALNVGDGSTNTQLDCRTIEVPTSAPSGHLDRVAQSDATVTMQGWAIDPSTAASVQVHATIDGVLATGVWASATRTDIAAAFPGIGAAHGFNLSVVVPFGTHRVCAVAINKEGDRNLTLGCRSVTVTPPSPRGNLDSLSLGADGRVTLSGWAWDPASAASNAVHVYADWQFVGGAVASQTRTDVAAAFPTAGASHGFSVTTGALGFGTHRVCAYSVSVDGQRNLPLGCREVTRTAPALQGHLDTASAASGSITVAGWVWDPSASASAFVHVYVDGRFAAGAIGSGTRTDVATAVPAAGAERGFSATASAVSSGAHQVCVYALSVDTQRSASLGCRTVVVP